MCVCGRKWCTHAHTPGFDFRLGQWVWGGLSNQTQFPQAFLGFHSCIQITCGPPEGPDKDLGLWSDRVIRRDGKSQATHTFVKKSVPNIQMQLCCCFFNFIFYSHVQQPLFVHLKRELKLLNGIKVRQTRRQSGSVRAVSQKYIRNTINNSKMMH